MVILKSTANPGLSLSLGVKVKKVLLVYFERHARRALLVFPRTLNNSILSTAYKKRAGPGKFSFFFFCKKKGSNFAPFTMPGAMELGGKNHKNRGFFFDAARKADKGSLSS